MEFARLQRHVIPYVNLVRFFEVAKGAEYVSVGNVAFRTGSRYICVQFMVHRRVQLAFVAVTRNAFVLPEWTAIGLDKRVNKVLFIVHQFLTDVRCWLGHFVFVVVFGIVTTILVKNAFFVAAT